MPLVGVTLDEPTLGRGSQAQRTEWEATIRELVGDAVCNLDGPATLRVEAAEEHFDLELLTEDGESIGTVRIEHAALARHIDEYLDVVRQITDADSLNQMEALDMAKKVTHDRAGRVVKRAFREYGFDLETSRRLFTLLLSLKVDTSRLAGLRGHARRG
jgi:uncharacterized protein (UPF0262 family)